ncbi:MAG TPA: WD40 repeat domain-containing protein [Candidatus Solibacter sp.]|nr:WD40 repeat domain-containing protein [Candidatus Solibacter sp.]
MDIYDRAQRRYHDPDPPETLSRMVVDPKGRRAAWIRKGDNSIHFLDFKAGHSTSFSAGDLQPVSLAFNPEGSILASGSEDGLIRLWWMDQPGSLDKARLDVPLRVDDTVSELAFSHDGRRLASLSAGGVLAVWEILEEWAPGTKSGFPMAFAPGITVASAKLPDRRLMLHQLAKSGKPSGPTKSYGLTGVTSIAVRRDGRMALAMIAESRFVLVDLESGQTVGESAFGGQYAALSHDGTLAAVAKGNQIMLLSLKGGKIELKRSLFTHGAIRCLTFGRVYLTACEDHALEAWLYSAPAKESRYDRIRFSPIAMTVSPDGRIAAWLDETNSIRMNDQDRDFGSTALQMPGLPRLIGFSDDGRTFQVLMEDGSVRSWPIDIPGMHQSACRLLTVSELADNKTIREFCKDSTVK